MKRYSTFITLSLITLSLFAEPDSKKAARSVFTLKTFDAGGQLLSSTNGFYIGEDGTAVSSFTPFRGSARAVVIDAQGKEWPVTYMLGANDMYDVAKFQVDTKKSVALSIDTLAAIGTPVWTLPYSGKKEITLKRGDILKEETFQGSYPYYTIKMAATDGIAGSPVINENGHVIGIMQTSAEGQTDQSFAVGVKFAADQKTNGLSFNDPALRTTSILKALPDEYSQAQLMLFVYGSSQDSLGYRRLVDDFIQKFPKATDGYTAKAQLASDANDFDAAKDNMEHAISIADKKDDAHFNYGRLIFAKEIYKSKIAYKPWNFDKAADEAHQAFAINPLTVYKQLEADVRFAQQRYADAYNLYQEAIKQQPSSELYFSAARCKTQLKDTTGMMAMLDSAVNVQPKPYLKAAAPYILARAQAYDNRGEYRKAVLDYLDYEKLMSTEVNDNFYYIRAKASIKARLFQQALDDFKKAIEMNPIALYYAELSALQIRVGQYQEAITNAKQCVSLDSKMSEGPLFLGYAQCLNGNKAEGINNLKQAKALGNDQAQALIDQYSK